MNGYRPLEHTLRYIICAISPSKDDWSIRFQLIEELRAVVEPIESLRGATVEPFGSFVSDLFTRWGDLDISIELANGSYIASAGKKHKQNLLEDVLKALKIKGGCRKLRFITNARVPILKFQGKYNISCDISINNLSGQMKSKLLYWISTIDGRFRHMVLLVKEWAKAQSINDSKSGTLNSYSLSLLVIFHFQTCEPAILPPLKEIYPRNMVDDLTGVRVTAENLIEETCAVNINRFKSNSSRAQNDSSLADLFISFIGKIEDPFEQPANTARSVSSTQLANISEAFQSTYNMLTSPNQDKKLLLSTLMKPPTTKFVGGTPTRNYGNYSRDGVRIQQAQRTTQPSLQHQFQDMRINRQQPNRAIHRPSQDSPAQLQPVWRPKYDKKVAE
nr:protein HESO1 [Ipomoea batatas]